MYIGFEISMFLYFYVKGGCPCGPPPTNASPPEPEPPVLSESEESDIGTAHPFQSLAVFHFD